MTKQVNHGDLVGITARPSNTLPVRDEHPESAWVGEMYFNSEHKCVYVFTGDEWSAMSKRPSHIKKYAKEFRL